MATTDLPYRAETPLVVFTPKSLLRSPLTHSSVDELTGGRFLEVRDDGPGVPNENRAEIFKPYFTTNEEGRGLGLAVVRQIVLAHGWEIECLPNNPTGACFRITHLKLAPKG